MVKVVEMVFWSIWVLRLVESEKRQQVMLVNETGRNLGYRVKREAGRFPDLVVP